MHVASLKGRRHSGPVPLLRWCCPGLGVDQFTNKTQFTARLIVLLALVECLHTDHRATHAQLRKTMEVSTKWKCDYATDMKPHRDIGHNWSLRSSCSSCLRIWLRIWLHSIAHHLKRIVPALFPQMYRLKSGWCESRGLLRLRVQAPKHS